MKINFNEESTKRIVEGYYKKYEDFDCKLEIFSKTIRNSSFGCARFFVPPVITRLNFVLKGILDVNGNAEEVHTTISHEEFLNAFKTSLEEDGYTVENLSFDFIENKDDKGVSKFNGISAEMSTKKKSKLI